MVRPTALQLAFSAATLIVAADLVVLAVCLMLLARSFARRRA